ncbi:MAG TPA: GerMN domain-containing protein [Actinomycetota bacterium]|nr:GerMN domain-containing protein [Actinomycetota bacterium]
MGKKTAAVAACVLAVACSTSSNRAAPSATPSAAQPSPAPTREKQHRNQVLVYQLREGREPYRPDAFGPSARPVGRARGTGSRLQAALRELIAGPTPAERRAGYTSAFGPDTKRLLLRVELRGRRAVVDFRDFRKTHPQWGTSYGGAIFLAQLNATVFQFDRIRSALYRIDRSCRAFWTFLEAGRCDRIRAAVVRGWLRGRG